MIAALNFGDARGCGKFLARGRVGKPVVYCSDACLMTMYRRRKKAASEAKVANEAARYRERIEALKKKKTPPANIINMIDALNARQTRKTPVKTRRAKRKT